MRVKNILKVKVIYEWLCKVINAFEVLKTTHDTLLEVAILWFDLTDAELIADVKEMISVEF